MADVPEWVYHCAWDFGDERAPSPMLALRRPLSRLASCLLLQANAARQEASSRVIWAPVRFFYKEELPSFLLRADDDPAFFRPSKLGEIGLSNADLISKILYVVRRPYWSPEVERELQLLDIRPSEFHINEVLKNIQEPDVANGFFQWIRRQKWYVPSTYSFSILLNTYGRGKDFQAVQRVLADLKADKCPMTTVAYNTLIKVYGKAHKLDEAWGYYKEMQDSRCVPDIFTFNTLMSLYSYAGQSEKVLEVYDEMQKIGCSLDRVGYEVVVPHAGKVGRLDLACMLFERMKAEGHQPNAVAYSALIAGQLKSGRLEIGTKYFEEMRSLEIRPLLGTFASLIEAYCKSGRLETGLKFFKDMEAFNYKPNLCIYAALVDAHAKAGMLDAALEFYERMRGVGLWLPPLIFAVLIEQHAQAGKAETAVRLYREMRGVGLRPSHFTCRIVVGAVAKGGKYDDVERILFEMQEMGLNVADAVNDSIVKLVDDKRISDAWELFLKVTGHGFTPHVSLCREILHGFLSCGDMEHARQMLSFMQRPGSAVDLRTYCMLLEFFLRGSRLEHEEVIISFMRETKHPAHSFLCGLMGSSKHRKGQSLADYIKSFYSELEAEVDFKTRRYLTNVLLNYLVVMGQERKARSFWKVVYQIHMYPNSIVLQGDLTWCLKVRSMSIGAALIGVLCTLEKFRERILKRRFVPQRIKILTGSKADSDAIAVRQAIEAMMKPLDSPFIFQDEDLGSFWCRGSFFVKWFRQSHVRGILRQQLPPEEEETAEASATTAGKLLLVGSDDMPLPASPDLPFPVGDEDVLPPGFQHGSAATAAAF
ncbi:pentatricopeptide repeat-containing protein At1g79490, mitochondrial [Selaginella moellendorffii]|nr:pentatricopeptide repeat-containing protein At1g79490, mitochondrial [Selaginella moellendorffii]|eukprot:XP_002982666.2 pentatricopeptide repeat-containing protein At1g79490, mitochondrial [Selaginella moellendorffii]